MKELADELQKLGTSLLILAFCLVLFGGCVLCVLSQIF